MYSQEIKMVDFIFPSTEEKWKNQSVYGPAPGHMTNLSQSIREAHFIANKYFFLMKKEMAVFSAWNLIYKMCSVIKFFPLSG